MFISQVGSYLLKRRNTSGKHNTAVCGDILKFNRYYKCSFLCVKEKESTILHCECYLLPLVNSLLYTQTGQLVVLVFY